MVSVYDRGFLYGDGVFETLRAYQGKIFKAREHVLRLFQSASAISLAIPHSPDEILNMLSATLEANHLKDARLRITLSRGTHDLLAPALPAPARSAGGGRRQAGMGLELKYSTPPTIVVMANPFSGHPDSLYQEGVEIAIVKTRKVPSAAFDPKVKSLNYLNSILAKLEAQACRVFEGILLNQDGHLCEGAVSNLFLVRQGELLTPSPACGILEGITRQTVIELAYDSGIVVKQGEYSPDEILTAEECFLTGTLMELMPAVRIRGLSTQQKSHPIGEGKVGPITHRLLKTFRKKVRGG
jgi:branched-chain amino acid aminotransferase